VDSSPTAAGVVASAFSPPLSAHRGSTGLSCGRGCTLAVGAFTDHRIQWIDGKRISGPFPKTDDWHLNNSPESRIKMGKMMFSCCMQGLEPKQSAVSMNGPP